MDLAVSTEYASLCAFLLEAKDSIDKAEKNEIKERYALLDARLAAELLCRFLIKYPLESLSPDAAKERERFRDDAPRITQYCAVLKVMYSNAETLLIKPLKHISEDTNSELHAGRQHPQIPRLSNVRNNLIGLERWVAEKYRQYNVQCEQDLEITAQRVKKKANEWNGKFNTYVKLFASSEGLQRISTHTDASRDLFDVILKEKSVLLIGGRGAGKTYSCKAAVAYLSHLKLQNAECPISEAFYVYIGDCSDNTTIHSAIEMSGFQHANGATALLLIDGFHEIKPEYRLKATEDLCRLINKSPENLRVLITARKETRPNLPVETEFRLLGFNHSQIEEYISKNLTKSSVDAENLSGLICKKAPRLHRLAHTPIFLKMMVSLYNNSTIELETLPVGQIIEKFIENELLGNGYPDKYKKMLSDAAFHLMAADCSYFTESDLEQISSFNTGEDLKPFLKLNLENGVLTKNDR
ncbi:MAG: hypothetical protein JNL74_17910, partial [Fibrobacteres bacterium]|nr:hypothetical protein [Fibrobacterota bacterium]